MFNMAAQVAVTIVSWLVIMFVFTNLLGFFVRGIFLTAAVNDVDYGDPIINQAADRDVNTNRFVNLVSLFVILFALWVVYYNWNIGVAIAALLVMAARAPDLAWEIKNGRSLQADDLAKPAFYRVSTALSWAALPILWYSLYQM